LVVNFFDRVKAGLIKDVWAEAGRVEDVFSGVVEPPSHNSIPHTPQTLPCILKVIKNLSLLKATGVCDLVKVKRPFFVGRVASRN